MMHNILFCVTASVFLLLFHCCCFSSSAFIVYVFCYILILLFKINKQTLKRTHLNKWKEWPKCLHSVELWIEFPTYCVENTEIVNDFRYNFSKSQFPLHYFLYIPFVFVYLFMAFPGFIWESHISLWYYSIFWPLILLYWECIDY